MQKELTSLTAILAMISNIAFALRSGFRKKLSTEFKARTKMNPANEHAVTTMYSFLLLIPVLYYMEVRVVCIL